MNPDAALKALAEPHRRVILELVAGAPRPVGDIASHLDITPQAVSRHLKVLRDAGLVTCRTAAQQRIYRVESGPLEALDDWLAPYRRLWTKHLDALERHLDEQEEP